MSFGKGGLSQYSAIANVLRLSKENYEAAIARHGQVCRWLAADKCACILESGRPDPDCEFCKGDGWVYRHRTTKIKHLVKAFPLTPGVFEVRDKSVAPILSVQSTSEGVPGGVVNGRTLLVSGVTPKKPILTTYVESRVRSGLVLSAVVYGGEYLKVADASVAMGEDTAPADIVAVTSVKNVTTGAVYTVSETSSNWIHIVTPGTAIQPADVLQVVCDVVFPTTFLITSQDESRIDLEWLQSIGGDGMMTYPDEYTVGEGDVITVLSSDISRKQVRSKGAGPYDFIPAWFVLEILELRDNSGATYVNGVDYILVAPNRLLWLTSNHPATGASYELVFRYSPTYRVLQQLPNTRNPESRGMPGKVGLKLFQTGGSMREGII